MVHYNFPQGPKNETDAQILTDIMDINGAGLAFVAYGMSSVFLIIYECLLTQPVYSLGVHATLFFLCFALLWEERRKKPKVTWGWIIYSTVLFILGTIGNGVNMFLKQDAIVNHRSYPGGPGQFEIEQYALPYNAAGTVIFIFGAWLIDGLMVSARSVF
ncbi:hypothetical protein EUX98_g868 [Antrodiella citrinella]|uniref:Uncharacterized protein n=1 Tax=Antrodiella citrinella TaxID=2447956 RepID=A0A4S4N2S7_9APHY|nr:hypothetical protein EUX98_g868 [Antrodiella citrinella]